MVGWRVVGKQNRKRCLEGKFNLEAVGNEDQEITGLKKPRAGRISTTPLLQGSQVSGAPAGSSGGCLSSIRGQQRPNLWAGPLEVSGRGVWDVSTGSPSSLSSLALLSSISSPQIHCGASGASAGRAPLRRGTHLKKFCRVWRQTRHLSASTCSPI